MKKPIKKPNLPIKKAVQIATTVLLIASTLLCFVTVASAAFGKEVSLFGFRLFYVATGSMEPTLPTGTVLIVRPCDEYQVNDIITFYSRDEQISGRPNTHRIIGTVEVDGELCYVTKGDANNVQDTLPVSERDIIGKVYADIQMSFIRDILGFLATPLGFFLLILLPILYVAVVSMKHFKDAVREELRRAAEAEISSETNQAKESTENETEGNDATE